MLLSGVEWSATLQPQLQLLLNKAMSLIKQQQQCNAAVYKVQHTGQSCPHHQLCCQGGPACLYSIKPCNAVETRKKSPEALCAGADTIPSLQSAAALCNTASAFAKSQAEDALKEWWEQPAVRSVPWIKCETVHLLMLHIIPGSKQTIDCGTLFKWPIALSPYS